MNIIEFLASLNFLIYILITIGLVNLIFTIRLIKLLTKNHNNSIIHRNEIIKGISHLISKS